MQGWIKLHRSIVQSELYNSERFTRSSAWIDLLILANHAKRTLFIKGNEINLNPGQLCYSMGNLAERWKWNPKTVKKFLLWSKSRDMVDIKTSNVTTIITILNWDRYQNDGEQNGERNGKRKRKQSGKRVMSGKATNKNVKNENNANNEEKVKKRYPVTSNEWKLVGLLLEKILDVDSSFIAPKFHNYWCPDMEELLKKISFDEIKNKIEYAFNNDYWRDKIKTAEFFRKKINHFTKEKENKNEKEESYKQNARGKSFKTI